MDLSVFANFQSNFLLYFATINLNQNPSTALNLYKHMHNGLRKNNQDTYFVKKNRFLIPTREFFSRNCTKCCTWFKHFEARLLEKMKSCGVRQIPLKHRFKLWNIKPMTCNKLINGARIKYMRLCTCTSSKTMGMVENEGWATFWEYFLWKLDRIGYKNLSTILGLFCYSGILNWYNSTKSESGAKSLVLIM